MLDHRSLPHAAPPAPARGDLSILAGTPHRRQSGNETSHLIRVADSRAEMDAYRGLRRAEFVLRQGLFDGSDADDVDDDPRMVTLIAVSDDGAVVGGVRVAPCLDPDIGYWAGSRLVVEPDRPIRGVGAALIRAACAYVETAGALRFDACVQDRFTGLFTGLGWDDCGADVTVRDRAHRRMRWPIGRIQRAADATKAPLAQILTPFQAQPMGLGPAGFRGDDGAPVPGTDLIAACDAIVPSMVERDPEWAGWCSVLVNINDLTAMGASPVGLLDAVGGPTRAHVERVIRGIAGAANTWGTAVLGGHTQFGVPSALAVTALGRTDRAIAAGAGRVGDVVSLLADTTGGWRPGYHGRQWDSSSSRRPDELRRMTELPALLRPRAAKDVSMAGVVGTLGMLAEASGTGAELDVAAVPRPTEAAMGDWLTCFPGYGMLLADTRPADPGSAAPVTSAACGRLVAGAGVRLRWPDGVSTVAVAGGVTGLGAA